MTDFGPENSIYLLFSLLIFFPVLFYLLLLLFFLIVISIFLPVELLRKHFQVLIFFDFLEWMNHFYLIHLLYPYTTERSLLHSWFQNSSQKLLGNWQCCFFNMSRSQNPYPILSILTPLLILRSNAISLPSSAAFFECVDCFQIFSLMVLSCIWYYSTDFDFSFSKVTSLTAG